MWIRPVVGLECATSNSCPATPDAMRSIGYRSLTKSLGGHDAQCTHERRGTRDEAPVMPAPKDPFACMSRSLARDWWKRAERFT